MLYWPRAWQREETAANGAFSMRNLLLLVLTTLALVAAGCGGTSTASLASDDAAVVGSKQITKDQLDALMARAQKSYDAQKRPFPKPGTSEYEQLRGQAITFLIQRAEFAQQADDMGINISGDNVDKRIEQLKKQFYGGSDERYKKTLQQQGLTEDQAKEEVRAQLISEELFKTQYGYHTIQARSDVKAPQTKPLSKVQDSIKTQLEQQRKNEAMTKWVDTKKKFYCGDTRIKYQVGYQPNPDPCASLTGSTSTTQ